jgi:hypothetical protein
MKTEIRNAIKNLSEELPPISDIEQMFDHLVSRVRHFASEWNEHTADSAGT